MLLAAQIVLIIAGGLLFYDAWLMGTHRPNPLKGMPLPCPVTFVALGVGIILLAIANFSL
jgi:hypothetical protein